ncbi:hypothetical protein P170DRAFT_506337 [Aspergillus steynii IBT 23096]|uniref:Uncharacterized protein n=1 Tax=Aspergillus steynii IBT 23096 TaxID=1392250 RepID=A0A2I2GSH4_9EURO|nr:uncharacterized protein P170DRAFT_506337 [Aspergillus steynii IBT 23096]PLB55825.1 hypothetical protein P170DRAFT_506337 [Aspergillus steynii IBT 23096]
MTSLSDIRNEILSDDIPKRLVIKHPDSRVLFLAIDVWSERAFLVIDINHHDYDFDTAHKDTAVFPVCVLRQRGRGRDWVLIRWPREDEPLAAMLADLHNVNGSDPIPFLEDHTSRLVHASPREFLA